MYNLLSDDKVHEECGVFGIFSPESDNVASDIYYGLCSLQHRGQESAGIAICDTYGPKGNITSHKDMGLVSEVFHKDTLAALKGNIGIGHVRYSTTGGSCIENAQPFVSSYSKGTLALVHNGNLRNTGALRKSLEDDGALFHGTSDSEVIAYLIAKKRTRTATIEEAVYLTCGLMEGGYALIVMSPRKIIGVRDPFGLKPLCLGKRGNQYLLASESCALTATGATFVRDVVPGEIITISEDGISSNFDLKQKKQAHCIFEYIYFARLDSVMDNVSIYKSRIRAGELLAKAYPVDADLVVGVPESGITAAVGYAQYSGIPFGLAFYKNSYVGRTFIKPTQKERESAVHMKLNVLPDVVKGKNLVLIDDSIVRGTTIAGLIALLKKAGAKSVHVRISSPPFLYPCYYGTDVPSNKELIASSHTPEEIAKAIGADSLGYLRVEDLEKLVDGLPICKACFNNEYPV